MTKVYGLHKPQPMHAKAWKKTWNNGEQNCINFPTIQAAKDYRDSEELDDYEIASISYHGYNPKYDPRINWDSPRSVAETAIQSAKNGNMKDAKRILSNYAENCEHRELLSVIQTLQKNWDRGEHTEEMRTLEKFFKTVYNGEKTVTR